MKPVYLFGDLNTDQLERMVRAEHGAPVLICSPGGSSDLCRAMVSLVRRKRMPTAALGEVSSAAALVFAAGSTRLCLPDSCFILHRPSICLEQTADPHSMHQLSQGLMEFDSWYFDRLEQFGLCATVIDRIRTGGDWTVSAATGLSLGFVDALLQPVDASGEEFHPLPQDAESIVRALNIPVDSVQLAYKT